MTLERQLEHEEFMVTGGVDRYLINTAKSEDKGQASETSYGGAFIRAYISQVAEEIKARIQASEEKRVFPGKPFWLAIKNVDPDVLAFITLRSVIDGAILESKLVTVSISIGKRVQDEVRLRQFQKVDEKVFNWTKNQMKRRSAQDYNFQLKSFLHGMHYTQGGERNGVEYFSMPKEQQLQTGAILIDAAIAATGHFSKETKIISGKSNVYIKISSEMEEWIAHHKEAMSLLFPVWTPTVIPPRDWESLTEGGFYSPPAVSACEFVITKDTSDPKTQVSALKGANLSKVYSAINHLQKTRWAINTRVLELSQQIWELGLELGLPSTRSLEMPAFPFPKEWDKKQATEEELATFEVWKLQTLYTHTAEKERIGKSALVSRVISMAERFKNEPEMFFVWHCDFRNRMYSVSSGLSPQGSDLGKAMLRFAEGKAIVSDEGEAWFLRHGANTFGVDKVSFDDQEKWVRDNKDFIIRMASDPISYREWANADKPWSFLAWAFEYKEFVEQGRGYISHLAIGQDGSCNGLQHFSAMLRDEVGGAAVNLVPSDKPQDIYAAVARKVVEYLEHDGTDTAMLWVKYGIDRSTVKRCVMTLPYGSTKQGMRDFLLEDYMKSVNKVFDFKETYKAVQMLAEIVWEAIGDVVVAARAAMEWLQQVAKVLSAHQLPITYTTPSGWVVHQSMRKVKTKQVETVLLGRTRITLAEATDKIDSVRQRNGISPNFVHSMDAAHLIATVNAAKEQGIESLAVIHDDYGTYAEDSQKFARIIREEFVKQYEGNVLQDFYNQMKALYPFAKIPEPPSYGNLDLNSVLDSKYFFA